ncbi:gliding motility lipoprotein GldH [Namhaeicola litoreus]|uniref:Gliding motility lipoprotein GldH n=1 Tax=Namhaeicola litoreus TaxID=1052145 RepID=A0ABW3XZQ2_9FLAO
MSLTSISPFKGTFVILMLSFLFLSCEKNLVFDQFQSVDQNKWQKDSVLNFIYEAKDTLSKNNIYVNLRNNKDYEYSNLFLIVGIDFPNNYQIIDTLEYEMTTPEGRFLGTGISDVLENKLEYKTNVNFPVSGNYTIHVQHAMRKSQEIEGLKYLNGITDVGIQIEKLE